MMMNMARPFKVQIRLEDGTIVWINLNQMVKMTKTVDGIYTIYLTNGDKYNIDRKTASIIENSFDDLFLI